MRAALLFSSATLQPALRPGPCTSRAHPTHSLAPSHPTVASAPSPAPAHARARPCLAAALAGARQKQLQALAGHPHTLLFYVPPHGLAAVLADCSAVLGGARRVCVARELTKMHEEYYR